MVLKLVYKIHSSRGLAESKFRLKLAPQEDELLSSWLVRLAMENRTMPSTFTNLYLPDTKNKLWASDVDLQAGDKLLSALSYKSSVPFERLRETTLRSYEGFLFEEVYSKCGGTPFILPLAMRGRRCTLPGLRYCPQCLLDKPYFRKKWRLSFSLACVEHRCSLRDRCADCRYPIVPYKAARGDIFPACCRCGANLASMDAEAIPARAELLSVVSRLYAILDEGFVVMGGRPVYSHLYFSVLHQILKIMVGNRWGVRLVEAVSIEQPANMDRKERKAFESISMADQAQLVVEAVRLLDDWPEKFASFCEQLRFRSSTLLRDMGRPPFWYQNVVMERLYRPDRFVADKEIMEAVRIIRERGEQVNEKSISRLLGVDQVFRKRSQKLADFI